MRASGFDEYHSIFPYWDMVRTNLADAFKRLQDMRQKIRVKKMDYESRGFQLAVFVPLGDVPHVAFETVSPFMKRTD